MRASLLALLAAASLVCLSASRCSGLGPGAGEAGLSILAYNAHNLFDAVDDGSEYAEFSVAKGRWDEGRYRARLAAVAEAVGAALPEGSWPDILCLEEIENRRVLEDLASGPLKAAGYRHIGIAPAAGSPVNSGILSRLPIRSLRAHGLASAGAGLVAPTRTLLEARVDASGGRDGGRAVDGPATPSGELFLFVLHWKSRIEGARETEGLRREAAALLASRIAELLDARPEAEIVACGDFNESPDEYLRVGKGYPTALMPAMLAPARGGAGRLLVASEPEGAGRLEGGEPVLYSPWTTSAGYSYSYKGGRERLDGFLLSGGLLDARGLGFRGFAVVDAPFLLGQSGEPLAWTSSGGKGYSDHLPVLLLLERTGS